MDANIEKIAALFPNCITETSKTVNGQRQTVNAIDFDLLRQELSASLVEGPQERYTLSWPGKNEAILTANAPIAKTLRPCEEESVDFENTRNIYIEGDNLDALKLLQETYLNKVKMIYIDPPYNTGNDFIYEDDFAEDTEAFLQRSNQKDEEGNRLVANTEANGRFHSDWLTMMYPRLKLARNLLREDGLIFLSIDVGEVANLRKIMDEIYGEDNFLSAIVWEKRFTRSNNAKTFATLTENILCYRKSGLLEIIREPRNEKADSTYSNPDNDQRGAWTSVSYVNPATREQRPNLVYPIKNPVTGELINHPTNAWKYERSAYEKHVQENKHYWGKEGNNIYPRLKKFLTEMDGGMVPVDLWDRKSVGTTDEASKNLANLFGAKIFDFPKPHTLVIRALRLSNLTNDIVLDFFSGSATTAHAVMQLNAEDNGSRKFIMVQIPEVCEEESEAFKAGYKSIAEIGKERIRRAGKKIKEENGEKAQALDTGFRVFKVDTSNMKDVYYTPDELKQGNLDLFKDHIKPDRRPEDLLFQVFIDWGIDLTLPIARETVDGKTVFFVDTNALIACFDSGITGELVKKLAKHKPLRVVFRDDAFGSDSVKINVEQIFKLLSPGTEVKTV